jgi:hypothetical protein
MRLALLTILGCLGTLAGATGCAPGLEGRDAHAPTIADLGPVPAGSAQVCVVRPEVTSSQVSMMVHDNGRLVGATRGTTFFCYLASPGDHQITSADDDTGPQFFHAQGGARYWLHQEVVDLAGHTHAHLDWVDESTALELLESCEARVRVSIPGHENEPATQPFAPAQKL